MASFASRLAGAAMLSSTTYEEVESDRTANAQAVAVVLLSGIAAGVGSFGLTAGRPIVLAVIGVLAVIVWCVWAFLTYHIGAHLLPSAQTRADLGELLRTLGFASSPGLLRVAGIIPGMTTAVFTITEVWMLVTMVVAIRHALDYTSTWRAVLVCAIGWIVAISLGIFAGMVFVPALS